MLSTEILVAVVAVVAVGVSSQKKGVLFPLQNALPEFPHELPGLLLTAPVLSPQHTPESRAGCLPSTVGNLE